jgi:hypothetical protein
VSNRGNKTGKGKGQASDAPFILRNPEKQAFSGSLPAPQGLSGAQALAVAARLQESGRGAEAETLLRQVTEAEPHNAVAWHMRGLAA